MYGSYIFKVNMQNAGGNRRKKLDLRRAVLPKNPAPAADNPVVAKPIAEGLVPVLQFDGDTMAKPIVDADASDDAVASDVPVSGTSSSVIDCERQIDEADESHLRLMLHKKRFMRLEEVFRAIEEKENFNVIYPGEKHHDNPHYREMLVKYNSADDKNIDRNCGQCIGLYHLNNRHPRNFAKIFTTSGHCTSIMNRCITFLERAYLLERRVKSPEKNVDAHMVPCVLMSYTLDHVSPLGQTINMRHTSHVVPHLFNDLFDHLVDHKYSNDVYNIIRAKNGVSKDVDITDTVIDISMSFNRSHEQHPHAFMYVGYVYDGSDNKNISSKIEITFEARETTQQRLKRLQTIAESLIRNLYSCSAETEVTEHGKTVAKYEYTVDSDSKDIYLHVFMITDIVNNILTIKSAYVMFDTFYTKPNNSDKAVRNFTALINAVLNKSGSGDRAPVIGTLRDIRDFGEGIRVRSITKIIRDFNRNPDYQGDDYFYGMTLKDVCKDVCKNIPNEVFRRELFQLGHSSNWGIEGITVKEGDAPAGFPTEILSRAYVPLPRSDRSDKPVPLDHYGRSLPPSRPSPVPPRDRQRYGRQIEDMRIQDSQIRQDSQTQGIRRQDSRSYPSDSRAPPPVPGKGYIQRQGSRSYPSGDTPPPVPGKGYIQRQGSRSYPSGDTPPPVPYRRPYSGWRSGGGLGITVTVNGE